MSQTSEKPAATDPTQRPGRIRHYVIAARDPDAVSKEIYDFLELEPRPEAPKPPGSGTEQYGFRTRMMRVGTTMLEIVTPIREPHGLHTFFKEQGGDGGYMVVMQTYDDTALLKRMSDAGLKLAMEIPNFAGQHLMQFDYKVFGTRFEFYRYTPEENWWGNPLSSEWKDPKAVSDIVGGKVAVENPGNVAETAAKVFLGVRKGDSVHFTDRRIDFVAPVNGVRGLNTLYLTARDRRRKGTSKKIANVDFLFV